MRKTGEEPNGQEVKIPKMCSIPRHPGIFLSIIQITLVDSFYLIIDLDPLLLLEGGQVGNVAGQ